MDKKAQKQVKEIVEKLFTLLEIDGGWGFEFTQDTIHIELDTKDSGIVIGYHGDVLESLQLVTALCVAKKLGNFMRVSIDVDNYKQNRSEYLKSMVSQIREKVIREGREITVPNLKPWERREVHLMLSEDTEVMSQSQGEGRERILVIKPRQ